MAAPKLILQSYSGQIRYKLESSGIILENRMRRSGSQRGRKWNIEIGKGQSRTPAALLRDAKELLAQQENRRSRLMEYALTVIMLLTITALAIPSLSVSAKLGLPTETDIVVLDAGHGGVDPGKVGVGNTLEKDINLTIVLKLKEYLQANGVTVYLTRESDDGLYSDSDSNKKTADMKARCTMIEEINPDLVVSIHQNSYSSSSVCGPQVFYYKTSEKGQRLATILQERLNAMPECMKQRTIKANGDYYLLLNVSCPIVIAETGFLSNRTEAQMLVTEEYQDRLAWELCLGILEYLNH